MEERHWIAYSGPLGGSGKGMSHTPYADAVVLRIAQLKPGQQRGLRLRLMEIRRNDKRPTGYFLQLDITCETPLRSYQVEALADFGKSPPPRATLMVVVGRASVAPPVTLVERGVPQKVGFTLSIDPSTEWVTLWVSTEGAGEIPAQLAGEMRLRQPEDERPSNELSTARLPSLKTVMRQSLMGAFRQSSSPALVVLGDLLHTAEPFDKRELVSRLLGMDADIRFVDAAVRDLAFAEQNERDFPPTDFARLVLDDPFGASLAVFHPGCPLPVVRECFVTAFEKQMVAATPASRRRWQELVKASAVVVCRKDRSQLDEGFAVATGIASEPSRQALFRSLVEWAWKRATPGRSPLSGPADGYLKKITGADPVVAERAACELLRHYELLGPTDTMA
jgi:hypothetical protein